jgi:hypothetical protein
MSSKSTTPEKSDSRPIGSCMATGPVAELLLELIDHAERVGAGAVAFVDEGDARHLVAAHLLVDGDGLGLHAAHGAQNQDGAVEHPQGPLHLDGEIDVPGGVDDVDLVPLPLAEGGGRGDGDAALALQLHAVHEGPDAVLALDVVHGVDALGVKRILSVRVVLPESMWALMPMFRTFLLYRLFNQCSETPGSNDQVSSRKTKKAGNTTTRAGLGRLEDRDQD